MKQGNDLKDLNTMAVITTDGCQTAKASNTK